MHKNGGASGAESLLLGPGIQAVWLCWVFLCFSETSSVDPE